MIVDEVELVSPYAQMRYVETLPRLQIERRVFGTRRWAYSSQLACRH